MTVATASRSLRSGSLSTSLPDLDACWASLKHGGLLIAPAKLSEYFPSAADPLAPHVTEKLRRDLVRPLEVTPGKWQAGGLLDTVLEDVLGLPATQWSKGSTLGPEWSHRAVTGEVVRPRRVWGGATGGLLPVFIADRTGQGEPGSRLGVGRGRRAVSRVVEWMRRADQKLALLTNGRQWRLLHAGPDYDAWAEWDVDLWFEEGEPGPQVTALRTLLGPRALTPPKEGEPSPLLAAVLASRRGQAELSSVLGERVRQAVELLVRESHEVLEPLEKAGSERVPRRDLYLAATRVVMRCVVLLFAEARGLLPRDNPIYNDSYGVQGLREQLDRLAGGRAAERLRHHFGAWPRLLALFRLVYQGSGHEALPVSRYGGGLFAPGERDSGDPVARALAAFESPTNELSDASVHKILELLTRSRVKVRSGRSARWVEAPVDFSDLSSEYIGILYEGLLDYELRRAEAGDPMVFLNVGDQPVLPFSRLLAMEDRDLAQLLEKLQKSTRAAASEGEEGEEGEEEEAEPEDDEEVADLEEAAAEPEEGYGSDARHELQEKVQAWAERAVKAAKLIKAPRGKGIEATYERDVQVLAHSLSARVVLPGEWFLVRWGGTRKGAGTFYTRPQLAGPTVRRTLQPLVYAPALQHTDEKTGLTEVARWTPRPPEQILRLKVCDPTMGSGSFLVAALRYLTDALVESLFHHSWLEESDGELRVIVPPEARPPWFAECVRDLPVGVENPEAHLRPRLKRHLVERCLYGVDLDPMAVELARLSLWVETMDEKLPFEFLDHKLKCGDSMVGCGFDRFRDYPILAWEREGGDKAHDRFVHHFRESVAQRGKNKGQAIRSGDPWTQAIKDRLAEKVKPELRAWVSTQREDRLAFEHTGVTSDALHDRALALFEELHGLALHEADRRAEFYRDRILGDPDFQALKEAFDLWCALWFWPGDALDSAPTPKTFLKPSPEARETAGQLTAKHRFFHWELEFPDVFTGPGAGFHAMVGNPPWEVQKPNSREFFSNVDPLYRTYGKQEALARQTEIFENSPAVETEWVAYCARLKALSNWAKHAGHPFGDPEEGEHAFSFSRSSAENGALHKAWRARRRKRGGYADPDHPFLHQGSADLNTYKLFLEVAHALLEPGGRLGFLVPSGLYTDKGSNGLRTLFLKRCSWEWLFGFINWNKIFGAIYYRFKFAITVVQKGGTTRVIRSGFSRVQVEDWEDAGRHALAYPRERVQEFSPRSQAILEIRGERDLEVLGKLYRNGVLLGDDGPDGWGVRYAREFDMTNDSKLFPPRPTWEAKGYAPDEYGHWLKGPWAPWDGPRSILKRLDGLILSADGKECLRVDEIEDVALPLYEGRMVGQLDFSEKGWVSGKGRGAVWREIPWDVKILEPQYLMAASTANYGSRSVLGKVGFLAIGSATNSRSMVACQISGLPCGNSVGTLLIREDIKDRSMGLVCVLNSLSYDFGLRSRLGGLNLNYFVIEETSVLGPNAITVNHGLRVAGQSLILASVHFAKVVHSVADLP
ncbi:MAG: hypothetical protein HY900_31425 [Deltaproteobacteria bacterium]|nr:hypothetical protein [Deltaproteobacteria bacterium]